MKDTKKGTSSKSKKLEEKRKLRNELGAEAYMNVMAPITRAENARYQSILKTLKKV